MGAKPHSLGPQALAAGQTATFVAGVSPVRSTVAPGRGVSAEGLPLDRVLYVAHTSDRLPLGAHRGLCPPGASVSRHDLPAAYGGRGREQTPRSIRL